MLTISILTLILELLLHGKYIGGKNIMFQVIGYIDKFTTCGNTQHVVTRSKRAHVAQQLISEESAEVYKIAIIDKGHKNGNEIHVIYNNGIIKVYNANTHKYITVLIAREAQIERYNVKLTKTMRNKIKKHITMGYNYI